MNIPLMEKLRADELGECLNFVRICVKLCHIESATQAEGSGENDVTYLLTP